MRIIKKWIDNLQRTKSMEELLYEHGISCWGLFPPSFYRTHSPEEIERISNAELANLKEMLEEYDQKINETKTP